MGGDNCLDHVGQMIEDKTISKPIKYTLATQPWQINTRVPLVEWGFQFVIKN